MAYPLYPPLPASSSKIRALLMKLRPLSMTFHPRRVEDGGAHIKITLLKECFNIFHYLKHTLNMFKQFHNKENATIRTDKVVWINLFVDVTLSPWLHGRHLLLFRGGRSFRGGIMLDEVK